MSGQEPEGRRVLCSFLHLGKVHLTSGRKGPLCGKGRLHSHALPLGKEALIVLRRLMRTDTRVRPRPSWRSHRELGPLESFSSKGAHSAGRAATDPHHSEGKVYHRLRLPSNSEAANDLDVTWSSRGRCSGFLTLGRAQCLKRET